MDVPYWTGKSCTSLLNPPGLVGDYSHTLKASLESSAAYLYLKAIDSPNGSVYHKGFLNLLQLLYSVLATTTNNLSLGPR